MTTATTSDWRSLVEEANQAARRAGYVEILNCIARAREQDWSSERLMEWLIDRLLQGPSDTWSGRNNDARRCYYEGVQEAVREYMEEK